MSATITTQDINRLEQLYTAGFHDPFLDNALRKIVARQIERDEQDLAGVNAALAQFESQYGTTSKEFWQRFRAGNAPDTADAMEWNALCKTQERIVKRLQILRGA